MFRGPPTRRELAIETKVKQDTSKRTVQRLSRAHHEMMNASTNATFGYNPMPGGRTLALPNAAPTMWNQTHIGGWQPGITDQWWD